MIIANPDVLFRFARRHPGLLGLLQAWQDSVNSETWRNPHEAIALHSNARILGRKRLIFNIRGNRYRIVAQVNYESGQISIRFIGTHEQYDRINAHEV